MTAWSVIGWAVAPPPSPPSTVPGTATARGGGIEGVDVATDGGGVVGRSPLMVGGTRLPLREIASTSEAATAAPPRAIVPSRRCKPPANAGAAFVAAALDAVPTAAVDAVVAAAAGEALAARAPAPASAAPAAIGAASEVSGADAASSSAMVSGPSTPATAATVSGAAGASSVGRIRTGAPSESSMIGSPGSLGVEPAISSAGPAVLPAARPSARMAPSPRAPAAAVPAPCRVSRVPVVLGTPVSCSTVGPSFLRTAEGSTRASPPIGTTASGQMRMTLALGATSWTMPTATTPIPSSMTTTSGRCASSCEASSEVVEASPTTS